MKEKIKEIIQKNLNGYHLEKVILFGSRSRGDSNADSDYDILAVVEEEIDWKERENICSEIRKELAKAEVNIDILIRSEKYIGEVKDEEGNVIKDAIEEGIEM